MVINMGDTVAVTHNFADEANLLHVKRSLLSESKETTQVLFQPFISSTIVTDALQSERRAINIRFSSSSHA